jgi:hypothetical protein
MKKFNINNSMFVQITEEGWAHLRNTVGQEYIEVCIESRMIEIEGEIWYDLQCWDVFEMLPPRFGCPSLFKNNVMFNENDLK